MSNPILQITDGSTSVDLLSKNAGVLLRDWNPSIAQLKGGGTYQNSVMSDGSQLVLANYDNAIETFNFVIHSGSQDSAIQFSQDVFRMLNKARSYWMTPFQVEPVYLVARAPNETNTRYAIIKNYRQENLDNPYATPFFGSCDSVAIDDITLVVERGHWRNVAPGTGEKVALSGWGDGLTLNSFTVQAAADDGWALLSATSYLPGAQQYSAATRVTNIAGKDTTGQRFGFNVRFDSVTLSDDDQINRAYIKLIAASSMHFPMLNGPMRIEGDDSDDATAPTNATTWNTKSRTSAYEDWYIRPDYDPGDIFTTIDISDIVEEIRSRPGWSSGNAMQFFIWDYTASSGSEGTFLVTESYEGVLGYDEPELVIETYGQEGQVEATDESRVYVANKWCKSSLTHIYTWRNYGSWSPNSISGANINITADPPEVGDAVYFGSDTTLFASGPFNNIMLDVSYNREDITWVWEYWQGAPTSAWTQFSAANIIDRTGNLKTQGYNTVTWVIPKDSTNGDWVAADLNAIAGTGTPPSTTGYWVRARVTAIGTNIDVQSLRPSSYEPDTYAINWPKASFASDQIGGDIPAVGMIKLASTGQHTSSPTRQNRAIVALQSDRGPYGNNVSYDFSAYLPFSDTHYPSVMSEPVVATVYSFTDDVTAPSGRCVTLAPVTTSTTSFYFTINSLHYFGSYRAFLRVRQIGGTDNNFQCYIATVHNGVVYAQSEAAYVTQQSTATAPNWQLLDLGKINIPTGLPSRTGDEGVDLDVYVYTVCSNATGDLNYMDLILMPTDEWIVDLRDYGTFGFGGGNNLFIDSIQVPKISLRGLTKRGGSPSNATPIPWKTIGSEVAFPANIGGSIWILTARASGDDWISDGITTTKIDVYTAEQYLGLRGSR